MLNLLSEPNVHSDKWTQLIETSHQTSLFVLPEWLDLFRDKLAVAVVEDSAGRWRAGVVAQLSPEAIPFYQYAGLLLTRREDPAAVHMLLEWLEEKHPGAVVVNSPALVDVRPFTWRSMKSGALWVDRIRYTMFTDKSSRPFPDMPAPAATESPDLTGLMELHDSLGVLQASGVTWGVDAQNRAYILAASPGSEGVVWDICQKHPTTDLLGCNSPGMNRRKRVFGARLRTYYEMRHVK